MNRFEFKASRIRLGLTQKQLAEVLGYENILSISALERAVNWRVVPFRVSLLMQAMEQGFRPHTWPKEDRRGRVRETRIPCGDAGPRAGDILPRHSGDAGAG